MTESVVVYSALKSGAAGADLAEQIRAQFGDTAPDAIILFASSVHDFPQLLSALSERCHPVALVGCSSAGEFVTGAAGTGRSCAVALRSSDIVFRAAVATDLASDRARAAGTLLAQFTGEAHPEFRYRSALVLSDALAGFTDELIESLTLMSGGTYQFFGGGAGDDAQFQRTDVFCGATVYCDAVVSLEMLSHKPIGLGVRHFLHVAEQGAGARAERAAAIGAMANKIERAVGLVPKAPGQRLAAVIDAGEQRHLVDAAFQTVAAAQNPSGVDRFHHSQRRRHLWCKVSEAVQCFVVERCDDHVVGAFVLTQNICELIFVGRHLRGYALDVEVEVHGSELVEHVPQFRYSERRIGGRPAAELIGVGEVVGGCRVTRYPPVGVVELRQVGHGEVGDPARTWRGAVHRGVVTHHQHTVGSTVHIHLQGMRTVGARPPECMERRRGGLLGAPLVCVVEHPALQPVIGHGSDVSERRPGPEGEIGNPIDTGPLRPR